MARTVGLVFDDKKVKKPEVKEGQGKEPEVKEEQEKKPAEKAKK